MANTLLCYGFGYTARALAAELRPGGWRVIGTYREDADADAVRAAGAEAVAFADADPAGADHLLISAPPSEAGDPVLVAHGDAIREREFAWIGYLSTTGVYGDTDGRWVDETAPLNPSNERSRLRAEAEAAWQAANPATHVFRLAGIYGPGRSAVDQVRAGTARRVVKEGFAFSRIHVADIVAVLMASMARPHPGAIYNLADDEPASQADVIAYACKLLGVDPPAEIPFDEAAADMSDMARSFWTDNRRIGNSRIKEELGVRLRYPSYREGLADLIE